MANLIAIAPCEGYAHLTVGEATVVGFHTLNIDICLLSIFFDYIQDCPNFHQNWLHKILHGPRKSKDQTLPGSRVVGNPLHESCRDHSLFGLGLCRVGFAHMKPNSWFSSCQLAFLVVVILSVRLSHRAMLPWWGGSHARLVLRGEDEDEDEESVIAGALLSLLVEQICVSKSHAASGASNWVLASPWVGWCSHLNMFWNIMSWICPAYSGYCLFWFVGLSLPSGHSWQPVIGSSLACRGLPQKMQQDEHQIRIDGKQHMYTNKLNQIDIKTYASVWMCYCSTSLILDRGCLRFALRICFGLHWGGSALSVFFWDRLKEWGLPWGSPTESTCCIRQIALPCGLMRVIIATLCRVGSCRVCDGHVHVADGFRSDGVLTIGR